MDPAVCESLLSAEYRFAKTMPENPHWYTLRKNWASDEAFVRTVEHMRAHGYPEIFEKRKYTMFNLNGWKYWTMGAPINYRNGSPCTILINRKPLDYASDYDLIADRYDTLFQDAESHRENMEIFGMIPIRHSDRILDVGCGTGLFLECTSLLDKLDYTGIDPSTKMLQRLAAQFPEYDGNIVNARLEEFYDGEGFDLIISLFGAANYIAPEAFGRVTEMLRPGGRAFLMFYQERYVPVTYEKTGVAFPYHLTSGFDISKFTRTLYKDTYLIAEYLREF